MGVDRGELEVVRDAHPDAERDADEKGQDR